MTTPAIKRHRRNVMMTLPPDVLERLDAIAAAQGMSRSRCVEWLVRRARLSPPLP